MQCKNGHEMTPDNIYHDGVGDRCRVCRHNAQLRYRRLHNKKVVIDDPAGPHLRKNAIGGVAGCGKAGELRWSSNLANARCPECIAWYHDPVRKAKKAERMRAYAACRKTLAETWVDDAV